MQPPSFPGINIPFLLNFQSCLIHYINYQFLEISPSNFPAIITKYNYEEDEGAFCGCRMEPNWRNDGFIQRFCKKYQENFYFLERLDLVTKMKWTCLAQFYLYPPTAILQPEPTHSDMHVPHQYFDFGVKNTETSVSRISRYVDNNPDKIIVTSRHAYRFLVTAELSSRNDWIPWSRAIDESTDEYFATHLLHVITKSYSNQILKTFVACLVCKQYKYPVDEIDVSNLHIGTVKKVQRQNFFHRNSVRVSFQYQMFGGFQIAGHQIFHFQKHFTDETQVELTKNLYGIAFPNYTEAKGLVGVFQGGPLACTREMNTECVTSAITSFTMQDFRYNSRIPLRETSVSYLTCFDRQLEGLSFRGFFSAFDAFTWISILTVYISSAGMLLIGIYAFKLLYTQKISNLFDITLVPKVYLALAGILLEQGQQYLASKRSKTQSALLVVIPALLGGVIISNAYKGENINQITSPFSLTKYDSFDALISNGFKIYSPKISTSSISSTFVTNPNFTSLDKALSIAKKSCGKTSIVSQLELFAKMQVPLKQQMLICTLKYYLNQVPKNITVAHEERLIYPNIFSSLCIWMDNVLNHLSKCDKVAYFEDEDFIKLYLLPALKYTGKKSVTYNIGKEKLHQTSFGTTIYNLRLPDIENRLHQVQSTGIFDKVYADYENKKKKHAYGSIHIDGYENTEPGVKKKSKTKRKGYVLNATKVALSRLRPNYEYFMYGRQVREPKSLTIQGNLISLFVVSCALLLVSILIYSLEFLMFRFYRVEFRRVFFVVSEVFLARRLRHKCDLWMTLPKIPIRIACTSLQKK